MTIAHSTPLGAAPARQTTLDAADFRHVIGHFMSGVAVVTTIEGDALFGMTASAVASLSLEPPMLVVCMNLNAPTQQAIARTARFGLNILEQQQGVTAEKFATPHADKFEGVAYHLGRHGQPLIDGALARLECEVVEAVVGGTHRVFLARVITAHVVSGSPLAYYRGRFGRFELAQDADALDALRQLVLRREINVDDPLSIEDLGERLQSPPSAMHYALTSLMSEGLVSRDLDRGWVQVPLDVSTSDQAFEAKLVIDRGAARFAVERSSDADLAELVALAEAIPTLHGSTEPELVDVYVRTNAAFHERMIALSGNLALVDAHRRLSLPGIMSQVQAQADAESSQMVDDHLQIARALRARDLEAVMNLVDEHHIRGRDAHRHAISEAGGRL